MMTVQLARLRLDLEPRAHVVSFVQNRHCRGGYKPLAKEFEAAHRDDDLARMLVEDLSDTSTASERFWR